MGRRGALAALFAAVLIVLTAPSAALAASPYPSVLPDFAHTGSPHNPMLSVASGDNDRPMLVVFGRFSDVGDTPGVNAGTIATQFFGSGFGSIADFFDTSSFGKFTISPAAETSGTVNDGVVTVDLGTYASWIADPATDGGYPSIGLHGDAIRGRKIVDGADPSINYASFDDNSDGNISDAELIVFLVQEGNPTTGDTNDCGATRGIKAGAALDGKTLNKAWSGGTTLTNTITHIHETSHQALGHNDHGYSAGRLDISGPTCPGGTPNTWAWDYNSWHKLHYGWIAPTIVTSDGFYNVGRWDTTGQAYLLYDYARGANDYFLVENRAPTPGSYEKDILDTGIVIWRVDETRFGMAPPNPYQLIRGDGSVSSGVYGGSTIDAWDPSDPSTPNSTLDMAWSDGTDSKVAVRAIGSRSLNTRVYFDVRGPGILVNPSAAITTVKMAQASPITFPVMNTGEATDSFDFTLVGLPGGWSASTQTQSIAADTAGTATVQLTVPGDIPEGNYTLTAKGTSTTDNTVTSSSPITVKVEKRATTLVYSGSLTGDYSDPASVSAVLTDTLTGNPLSGKTVSFGLGTQSASGPTDGAGTATGVIVINQPAGNVPVSAAFAGDGTYLASNDSDVFAITKESLTFVYTGDTLVPLGSTPALSAIGTEESDGASGDLTLAQAEFTLAPTLTSSPFAYLTSVGPTGAAATPATGLPVDLWSVTVAVPGSNAYWEGATTAPTELVLFDPDGQVTGSGKGTDSVGDAISVNVEIKYKGLAPKGNVKVNYSGGRYHSTSPSWLVQVGDAAIMQLPGLRLRVEDNGEPSTADRFLAKLGGYDSGWVVVTSGNIQTHQ